MSENYQNWLKPLNLEIAQKIVLLGFTHSGCYINLGYQEDHLDAEPILNTDCRISDKFDYYSVAIFIEDELFIKQIVTEDFTEDEDEEDLVDEYLETERRDICECLKDSIAKIIQKHNEKNPPFFLQLNLFAEVAACV